MPVAQIGMGFSIDYRLVVATSAEVCGIMLALITVAWYLLGRSHRGLLLGLGIGVSLVSSLSMVLWVSWSDGHRWAARSLCHSVRAGVAARLLVASGPVCYACASGFPDLR